LPPSPDAFVRSGFYFLWTKYYEYSRVLLYI
jgi:hypothetical protein